MIHGKALLLKQDCLLKTVMLFPSFGKMYYEKSRLCLRESVVNKGWLLLGVSLEVI